MLTRRTCILAAAAAIVTTAPAMAADASAHDFVAAIYNAYVGKNGNGVALDSERTVRRYFEPGLAALILKDQENSRRRNEVGVLDFDPFVDAQDWEISAFSLAVSEAGPDKASATVTFTSFTHESTIVLDLVKSKDGWKVGNITWTPHDKPDNLRALFTQ
ncbi:MAG: DUF3828 domain-containing protein [Xanthobacteraceae bacterium]